MRRKARLQETDGAALEKVMQAAAAEAVLTRELECYPARFPVHASCFGSYVTIIDQGQHRKIIELLRTIDEAGNGFVHFFHLFLRRGVRMPVEFRDNAARSEHALV